ncbi:MAG: two-component system sensor histidine kinase [Moraxellaceae bacterium]|jgi:signal transduction histidine kinase|nr:two-component system sensor histidine kinase [Moraxellaceae bacterium]
MPSRLSLLLAYLRTLPRTTRQELLGPIQLGLLGYLAWLLGSAVLLWHAWQAPGSQPLIILLLCLTSGLICLGLGLYLLVGFLLPPARWHRDNRDWRLWFGLVAGSAFAFAMPLFHDLSQLEYFFHCFFLLNYVPLLARFRFPVALAVLGVEAVFVALLSGGLFGLFLGGYFALQGLALLWLTNAVLLERHFRTETELHAARLAGTRELLQQAVAETERARLARDLHDDMGHHLVALNLRLQLLERSASAEESRDHLVQARALAGMLFTDLRNTVRDLREPTLDLEAAIEALAAHLPGLGVELDMALEHGEVSIAEAECLLRCIQEAMTNALKHGRASRVRVALERRPDGLLLQVEDNGRSPPGNMDASAGHGLQGLRERVAALSGRLWTERAPEGFVLYAHLPRETEP